jgi:hypothetical protein
MSSRGARAPHVDTTAARRYWGLRLGEAISKELASKSARVMVSDRGGGIRRGCAAENELGSSRVDEFPGVHQRE